MNSLFTLKHLISADNVLNEKGLSYNGIVPSFG